MADASALSTHLPITSGAETIGIHGDGRCALRAAIGFERLHAEVILEGPADTLRKFFSSGEYVRHAAEIGWRAPMHVGLKERWRRQEKCNAMFPHQSADRLRIERIAVIHHADSKAERQREC